MSKKSKPKKSDAELQTDDSPIADPIERLRLLQVLSPEAYRHVAYLITTLISGEPMENGEIWGHAFWRKLTLAERRIYIEAYDARRAADVANYRAGAR